MCYYAAVFQTYVTVPVAQQMLEILVNFHILQMHKTSFALEHCTKKINFIYIKPCSKIHKTKRNSTPTWMDADTVILLLWELLVFQATLNWFADMFGIVFYLNAWK